MAPTTSPRRERGAAVVDFSLVLPLLLVVFLLVLQLGIALHVRNTVLASAAEGARAGARVGATPQDGVARTAELISTALSPAYAGNVTAVQSDVGGVAVLEVRVVAPVPVLGLLGPDQAMDIRARAFVEAQ